VSRQGTASAKYNVVRLLTGSVNTLIFLTAH
jgi:hypothetical protein